MDLSEFKPLSAGKMPLQKFAARSVPRKRRQCNADSQISSADSIYYRQKRRGFTNTKSSHMPITFASFA
eukprot:5673039-Pleurochrysis_carterae.AAC.2